MGRVGLVLGAGGVVGHAFHAGVLRALADTTGWDPRSAEVIVGTSAGAHVAALLRGGFSAADVAARTAGEPVSADGARVLRRIGPNEPVPGPRSRSVGMAAPGLLLRSVVRPWRAPRLGSLTAAALPRGRVSLDPFAARLRWLFDAGWPEATLWLCAVRLRDGRRVVLGRPGAPTTDVGTAVAASCAIPGWFAPVRIGAAWYVDGGVHSPTNLDVLAGLGLDLVVVSAPMSVARGVRRASVDLPARQALRLRLAEEARRVRRQGTQVVAFQPTAPDLEVMGLNAMNPRHRYPVVRRAHESVLRRLERPDFLDRLAALAPRSPT
ncbi:MAG TPA: patatin-like phospholipase family protein [Actinomycetota bacterium]|nr:patatin-like phospholipase family protein [Actinomycetota bacterium]